MERAPKFELRGTRFASRDGSGRQARDRVRTSISDPRAGADSWPKDADRSSRRLRPTGTEQWRLPIAGRGLEPARQEDHENGVRKADYLDPAGNEIGIGSLSPDE